MRRVVLIIVHWWRHCTRDTSTLQSYYTGMAQSWMLWVIIAKHHYKLYRRMALSMSLGGYSLMVQMRIGNHSLSNTPLMLAAVNGHLELVRMLFGHGAHINGTGYAGTWHRTVVTWRS